MNDIRVLLVESETGDAGFIREALIEMEEMTHGGVGSLSGRSRRAGG